MGKFCSHIVPLKTTPQRLQEYGVGLFEVIPTKSALKKALKKDQILVNGTVASTATIIKGGETILFIRKEISVSKNQLDLTLKVLFEDDYLAAVNKPAGILVSGNSFRTITNALSQNLKKSEQTDSIKPQPVHRLDYATTGVLLIGKTAESVRRLNKLFEKKEIEKTYYAVTIGAMKSLGRIETRVDDKEAITDFEKTATLDSPRYKYLNLVKLTPKTGRRHQLRIHMAALGNSILGDRDYAPDTLSLKGKGMYLHAYSLEFLHPFTNELQKLTASIPERFTKIFGRTQDILIE
jgi:23S rRNA pseudouridine1911/1915/1917 synthase